MHEFIYKVRSGNGNIIIIHICIALMWHFDIIYLHVQFKYFCVFGMRVCVSHNPFSFWYFTTFQEVITAWKFSLELQECRAWSSPSPTRTHAPYAHSRWRSERCLQSPVPQTQIQAGGQLGFHWYIIYNKIKCVWCCHKPGLTRGKYICVWSLFWLFYL